MVSRANAGCAARTHSSDAGAEDPFRTDVSAGTALATPISLRLTVNPYYTSNSRPEGIPWTVSPRAQARSPPQ
jgi:hypothetical protein